MKDAFGKLIFIRYGKMMHECAAFIVYQLRLAEESLDQIKKIQYKTHTWQKI